jgi:hypothetical protein
MREAFRGRAAAYEETKQYHLARTDLNTLVLLQETALQTEKDLKQPYSELNLDQAIQVHRERARFLDERGQTVLAQVDRARAQELEGIVVSLKPITRPNSWIRLVNDWDRDVVVILDKQRHVLKPREEKKFRQLPGPYTYEVPGVVAPRKVELEDGKINTIRISPPEK